LKTGTENRNKVIAAAVLGVLAVILLMRMLMSESTPPTSSAAPVAAPVVPGRRAAARRTTSGKASKTVAAPSLDPTLRLELLKESEDTKYSGSGRNIFNAAAEPIPVPKGNGTTDKPKQAVYTPPTPPPPPPITLKFYGFANKPGEPKRVFLMKDDDTFIAGEGDIVDRRYRVLHIGNNAVEIEDVINNNRQSIPLTQG
jgi:hypothetical protein